jgi:CubicO group peptidase (beta-lactamase class C family)
MKISSLLFFILNTITLAVDANVFDDFKVLNSQTPGCAIGVVKKDKLVYENYFGQANLRYQVPIDRRTVFNLGSITKHFTAALALKLEKKGQLSLNDSLKKYYPQGPKWFGDVKLHHLINHQSGLPDYLNDEKTRTVLVEKLSTIPNLLEKLVVGKPITRHVALNNVIEVMMALPSPLFIPGNKTSYSNTGYLFLADILEKVSGLTFSDLANINLFKPLAMSSTELMSMHAVEIPWSATGYDILNASTYQYRRNSINLITQGEGGLLTTLPDFARWVSHLIKPKRDKTFWDAFLNSNDPKTEFKGISSYLLRPLESNTKIGASPRIGGDAYNNGLSNKSIKNGVTFFHGGFSIDSMASYFWVSPAHKVGYIQLCNFNFHTKQRIEEILEIYGEKQANKQLNKDKK